MQAMFHPIHVVLLSSVGWSIGLVGLTAQMTVDTNSEQWSGSLKESRWDSQPIEKRSRYHAIKSSLLRREVSAQLLDVGVKVGVSLTIRNDHVGRRRARLRACRIGVSNSISTGMSPFIVAYN